VSPVQLLQTFVYMLAVGGGWHVTTPSSEFSCMGFRILQNLSASCADTSPAPKRLETTSKLKMRRAATNGIIGS
jgi:hypothetical protein